MQKGRGDVICSKPKGARIWGRDRHCSVQTALASNLSSFYFLAKELWRQKKALPSVRLGERSKQPNPGSGTMQQNHANGWAKAWQCKFCFLTGKLVSAYFKLWGSTSAAASLHQYKTVCDKQEVSSHLETQGLGSRQKRLWVCFRPWDVSSCCSVQTCCSWKSCFLQYITWVWWWKAKQQIIQTWAWTELL